MFKRPARPTHREVHALAGLAPIERVGRALVEDHGDIAAERLLYIDGGFGREQMPVSIEMGAEENSVFAHFAETVEAKYLEAARIRENGAVPVHEAVEAAELADEFMAGAEVEVVGIRENDFGVEFRGEVIGGEPFHRRLRAHRHKDGGFDGAVGGMQHSGPGAGFRASGLEFKAKSGFQSSSIAGGGDAPERIGRGGLTCGGGIKM